MLRIGITGGIGSGKSMICRIFGILGIPVYDADQAARVITESDPVLIAEIKKNFGEAAYDAGGKLNRKYIAGIVFNDRERLALLNSLVHPATIRDAENWMKKQTSPYAIKEAALMFESESFHHVDKVIGVSAPRPLRILRAMQRDGLSREEVTARMDQQMNEEIKMRLCDYIVYNDEQRPVIPQVMTLHEELVRLAVNSQ